LLEARDVESVLIYLEQLSKPLWFGESWGGSSKHQKSVLLFAARLLISLGLCGLNREAFHVLHLSISGGPSPGPHGEAKDNLSLLFINAAIIEVIGIIIGAVGLVIAMLLWIADEF
jgi:hypothetical protein